MRVNIILGKWTPARPTNQDEVSKTSSYLWENMSDPETGLSPDMTKAIFNRAFDWSDPFWTWLGQPEQVNRQRRFGVAMKGITLEPVDSILKGMYFPFFISSHYLIKIIWLLTGNPCQRALVGDVGGGVGTSSMIITKNNSDVKIVVQDLPPVAEAATAVCP